MPTMIKIQSLPLDNISVSSSYGPRNITVDGVKYWWHNGVDFYAEENTPVYAVASGTVKAARFNDGGYGYYVAIDHGNYGTLYAHLNRTSVFAGSSVEAGSIIGYSGKTGAVTGPHLHFEIRITPYENFWDRVECDSSVFMRTVDPMLFIEEYQKLPEDLSVESAREIVKTKAALEDKTMDYIVNDYRYGHDLVKKLAKALQ
jgi:murein DD-endopeptidase MepM/ murein hydrolase activator NlpD